MEKWKPVVGKETNEFLDNLKAEESDKDRLKLGAKQVLSQCISPEEPHGATTGLVLGHIQSGKTRSFTTVITLARDNSYPLVVVMTGRSKNLNLQSLARLKSELRLETRRDRKWLILNNPRVDSDLRQIRDTLANWNAPNIRPDRTKTVLITVMKNHLHLEHLAKVIEALSLGSVPCLVVDDEGDQASLNTRVNDQEESTTYQRILRLRSALPHHSYLQYTATPQALLLINIIDTLSPEFAVVLDPGKDYVGLEEFFVHRTELVNTIPSHDLFGHRDPPASPPGSLVHALRLFFIGVAAGYINEGDIGNRTMLIHPSHRTSLHALFLEWIHSITDKWVGVLEDDDNDEKKFDLLAQFKLAYTDMERTATDLPGFHDIEQNLVHVIRGTKITELNTRTGPTSEIDWYANYAHIVVGGQSVDRGYTVEGLTVTYLPRSLGAKNIDTLQQRARFLGYRKSYLNYCRIYVGRPMKDFYRHYVGHEESIRNGLKQFSTSGQSLDQWSRQFLIPPGTNPTRHNVVGIGYFIGNFAGRWFIPLSPHFDKSAVESNRQITYEFLETLNLGPDEGHPDRTDIQKHLCSLEVSLRNLHEELLTRLRFLDKAFTGVRMQIAHYLSSHPQATCSVYKMSSSADQWRIRSRELDSNFRIRNLMQGPHPNSRGRIYPGDRRIGDQDRVIMQIHKLRLLQGTEIVADDVIGIAIRLPKDSAVDWLAQDQENQ